MITSKIFFFSLQILLQIQQWFISLQNFVFNCHELYLNLFFNVYFIKPFYLESTPLPLIPTHQKQQNPWCREAKLQNFTFIFSIKRILLFLSRLSFLTSLLHPIFLSSSNLWKIFHLNTSLTPLPDNVKVEDAWVKGLQIQGIYSQIHLIGVLENGGQFFITGASLDTSPVTSGSSPSSPPISRNLEQQLWAAST